MKFIHCADLHLDSPLETNLSRDKATRRRRELIAAFEQMSAFARDKGVRAVLVAGDLFDRNKVTLRSIQSVSDIIAAVPEVDFLVLSGNHDSENPFLRLETLPDNLHFFGENWTYYSYDDTTIGGISLCSRNRNIIYSSLSFPPSTYNIAVMHGDIASEIHLNELRGKNIDYLALGHLHERQEGSIDARGSFAYSGCLEGRGFDESGVKGFYLIDTDRNSHEFITGLTTRTMYTISVDITEKNSYAQLRDAVDAALSAQQVRPEDMAKIILTGSYSLDANKDLLQLQAFLDGRLYFAKLSDHSHLQIRAEDYQNDVSLKGALVRAVEQSSLAPQEKEQVILCGLRAILGEEF